MDRSNANSLLVGPGSAPGRPQVGPESARKQIKHISPSDFRVAAIRESPETTGNQLRTTPNATNLPIHLISSSRSIYLSSHSTQGNIRQQRANRTHSLSLSLSLDIHRPIYLSSYLSMSLSLSLPLCLSIYVSV